MAEREPGGAADAREAHPPTLLCPHCGSADVEPLAVFGSQLMGCAYTCRACRTPFEGVRRGLDHPRPTRTPTPPDQR